MTPTIRHAAIGAFCALGALCIAPVFALPLYLSPAAYYSNPDSGRSAGGDYGFQLTAGYLLSDRFSFDLVSESARYRLNSGAGDTTSRGASFQTTYTIVPGWAVSPLVLGGVGWLHTGSPTGDLSSIVARGGVGLRWQYPASNFGLQTSAVVRHEVGPGAFNDLIVSVGLNYRFGNPVYHDSALVSDAVPPAEDGLIELFTGAESGKAVSTPAGPGIHGGGLKGADSKKDSDGDGVDDEHDKCPDTPPNAVVDSDGCIIYMKK